jgi:uncharacterized protein YkwD
MALERVRAHGAAVGTIAVVALAGLSVVSLVLAEGRLEQFDRDHDTTATTASAVPAPPAPPAPPATDPGPSAPPTTVAPGPPSGLLADLLASINADRVANGLPPLAWDERLRGAAQHAADAMAAAEVVAPPDGDALFALGFARAGQVVLTAPSDVTAASAEHSWMSAAPQRATILDAAFQRVGIGASTTPDGRIWFTVDFGAPTVSAP